jgi:uncharacterized protein YjbI with pentapeptide repeats
MIKKKKKTKRMRKITAGELSEVLKEHERWIDTDKKEGQCADLRDADLRKADLSGANLKGATLISADLSSASLKGADLDGAKLRL